MKKIALCAIALIVLTGCALADRGIDPVPETQGIVTSTSVNLVGNFGSATELQWRITDDTNGIPGIPPLTPPGAIYESTYTEDTQTHGVGLMLYDKELDVETSGQITGQWNVEATKQIAFIGVDGAAVVSSDAIMVDGAGHPYNTYEAVICPFAEAVTVVVPSFCNRAEAGSTIDMTVANVRTTTTDRFVMPSGDHPVELNHDIRVTELVTDVPSIGLASAYLEVLIQEAGPSLGLADPRPETLMERVEFTEETSADGAITLFEKLMHYESGMVR
ncbi:MAG: hypothetical protein GKC07_08410 [Methanomicrobiales archaeon]|nr:hypothetical protein [Methanomicrobiales archaeon]